MAVARRSTCLILLLVTSFYFASVLQAQTDYSFSRWSEARERLAKVLAADAGISVEVALYRMRFGHPEDPGYEWLGARLTSTRELRRADLEQFEKDKADAAERGTTVEAILAERLAELKARARLAPAEARKKRAEAEKREAIQLAVAAAVVIVVIVVVFRTRRRIATAVSRGWRGRSKAFRNWAFGSFFWVIGTFLFALFFDPYDVGGWSGMDEDEIFHMFSVMIVPSLFLGAAWFGYKRFVS